MTTIFLDTSVAITESFLKSPFAEAFLKACAILQHRVVIPEIVLDELKGNFPKRVQEKSLAFLKAGNDLGKLIEIDIPTTSINDVVKNYVEWLDTLIDSHGVVIAPYPNVSLKQLIEKSYEIEKPFKDSGEGHKDYIVWLTILEQINSNSSVSPFIFLTNNVKDFCDTDKEGKYIPHSNLAAQIDNDAHIPKIYTSIKTAFETELSPHLEGVSIDDIPALGSDIDSLAEEFLLQDLPRMSLYGLDGLPFNDDVSISSVGAHSIDSIALKKAGNEIVISITGSVEVEANGFIEKFNFYHLEDSKTDVTVIDGNWNDHVMLVSSMIETPFELTIFYSAEEHKITGREISLLDEIEDEWPYK